MMPKQDDLELVNAGEYEFSQLTDEDWRRLDLAAKSICRLSGIDSTQLLLEAVDRVIDGRRKWPVEGDIPFRVFLYNVMRSIHYELVKKEITLCENYHEYASPPAVSSEEICIGCEYENKVKEAMTQLAMNFSKDEDVTFILVGRDSGMKRREIMKESGMDATRYDTATKRIRRYFDKQYPMGKRYE